MKRELEALEAGSPILDSINDEDEDSSSKGSGRVSLVYKRVKRSIVRVKEVDLVSDNVVNEVGKDHTVGEGLLMEVERKDNNNEAVRNVGDVSSLEVGNKEIEVMVSNEDNGAVINSSSEENGLLEIVVCEVNDECLTGSGDPVIVDAVNDNENVDVKVKNVDSSSDFVIIGKEISEPVVSNENVDVGVGKDVEESMLGASMMKMEVNMSKQATRARLPTTVKELLETGLLEGCPVYYNGNKGSRLRGKISGFGILCSCGLCKGNKVIPPSLFEIHACNTYKRAAEYICLANGRSFIQVLKACKSSRSSSVEVTVQNAIGPLPERKLIVCWNCKESFSSMDAESSEAVCSSCVMSNTSSVGPVFSFRRLCRPSKSSKASKSSKSTRSLKPSRVTSTSDVIFERSQETLIEKPSEAAAAACDGLSDCRRKRYIKKSSEVVTSKSRISARLGKFSDSKIVKKIAKSSSRRKFSKTKASKKLMKNSQEPFVVPETCSSSVMNSSVLKTYEKLMKKSREVAFGPNLSHSTWVGKSSSNDFVKSTKRLGNEVVTPKLIKNPSVELSSEKKSCGKITKKDLRLHKLVFEDDVLPDGTELGYYARGKKLLDGYKKGSGIFCSCCETVVSASQFEVHAGCPARRKPYCYIYTSNGVSLHELSINLIKGRTHSTKFNDDLCSICADGGNLLLCDGCPRAFHMECASLSSLPCGKWFCKYCLNTFEREKFVAHNANAIAAGRVSGVDPMEQITTRSIRIVDNMASELSSCILCRGYDFCKSGFGPRTIILCDQCEKEYHVGCLKDHSMADLMELPDGKWFCSVNCGRIESSLQILLVREPEKLPESLVDVIRKKHVGKGYECAVDFEVSWRLLSGKIVSPQTRPLLSQAVAIFHESFSPIINAISGQDLIAAMVYGRSVAGQEYGGMYCATLTVNSVVVSAGIFRVLGSEVAELPLVATSTSNQGKGYFQTLFSCIERLLAFLQVKSLVLPAAEEAKSIWIDRFGFSKMTSDQLREFKRHHWSIVCFQGTSMLHKSVPKCRIIQRSAAQ